MKTKCEMIKRVLILCLLFVISSCADVDYVQYYNYYYINATKYDFDKIVVFANNKSCEYQINKGDTLAFYLTENDKEPIMIDDYVDSVYFYYNDTLKIIKERNSIGHIMPAWDFQFESNGKHDEINDSYYIFADKYFE